MKRFPVRTSVMALATAATLSCSTVSSVNSAGALVSVADTAAATVLHGGSKTHGKKPTVVLVHGAWADSAGWTKVVIRLQKAGFRVVAPPNPLRGLSSDAAYIRSTLEQINGPIVLVGHSYGGAVITNAATGNPNVKALVYIAAFAPDEGESLNDLNGSRLGKQIPAIPVKPSTYPKPDGSQGTEVRVAPAKYPRVFLNNELPRAESRALAVEQRPLSVDAAGENSGTPAWKTIPSWYLVSRKDHAIAPNLERFMAKRANARTVQVDSPHLALVTDPKPVAGLIERAAASVSRR